MTEQRKCNGCDKQVIEVNGRIVHIGGGANTQICRNPACGWQGGAAENFTHCPSCGDGTSLVVGHQAS